MSKPKTFRPWNPEQTLLLPPSPVEWLPANHLVFFLLDMAAELDLSAIYAVYEARDPRGVKAYEPRMMVVLLLYAYCVGIPSSRRIERACWEDAAFRVLTGNQQPDHSRISDFRLVHLDALAGLFVQVLRLCQKAGLLSLGNVALDGTKVKANASKHKAMSHVSGDNEVGRSATNSLAGWVSAGVPGADAQGPGDAGTTDESPTQPVHGETTRWQQPGGCCRSGGHLSAQCPPD
jgi:transposase